MIYWKYNDKYIEIPKHYQGITEDAYELELRNNVTNTKFAMTGLVDESDTEALYKFRVTSTNLAEGEYTYRLYNWYTDYDKELVEFGLLTFGDYVPENKDKYTFYKEIKQYEKK